MRTPATNKDTILVIASKYGTLLITKPPHHDKMATNRGGTSEKNGKRKMEMDKEYGNKFTEQEASDPPLPVGEEGGNDCHPATVAPLRWQTGPKGRELLLE